MANDSKQESERRSFTQSITLLIKKSQHWAGIKPTTLWTLRNVLYHCATTAAQAKRLFPKHGWCTSMAGATNELIRSGKLIPQSC